ncbi:DNA topoisomerase [Scenedesmus sp. NREL 46B-D3]|nr:DNA topoisomerase [Scenedesmus sp. NREL 46B-D3]
MPVSVLMVAEKPSLAQSIAQFLSNGQMYSRRASLDVHEFSGNFKGQQANFKMTSVIGHVYNLDFPPAYNSWDRVDPLELFGAETVKGEANPKAHVCRHLQGEGKGADYLVLWLDCDREGENICFEVQQGEKELCMRLLDAVMDNVLPHMKRGAPGQQAVFRARFSAVSAPEVKSAMVRQAQQQQQQRQRGGAAAAAAVVAAEAANLGAPNQAEALAVDARQELDLKVGVAFTRFQTRFFQGRYGNLDATVVSYGPCQTPTLGFTVERHQAIVAFQPEPFWVVRPQLAKLARARNLHASLMGGRRHLNLEWERGRVFDQDVGQVFAAGVRDAGSLRVQSMGAKEERRPRPPGLNTVELLKVAERLYTSGYLSYPRTESSGYPPNFDFDGALSSQARHPIWGQYAASLLSQGVSKPKGGVDVGDHPPITPVRAANEAELGGGDSWLVYDYVARHFLASLSGDCVLKKTKAVLVGGGETFTATGSVVLRPGFTAIMPWKVSQAEPLPPLSEGQVMQLKGVELSAGKTSPPDYLTEAELIGLMEKHGIGTDASIPTHINNICVRNYVQIQSGRRVVPTELGITLIKGYQLIDPELCRPHVRAHVEQQIGLIADGKAQKEAVVAHTLEQFRAKFMFFVGHITRMDALFEASFSPLASSGGAVKQYKGLECPLDGFELVLFSLSGSDGKTYPLCPLCYNYPPFEGVVKAEQGSTKLGMPCTSCLHPTCKNSPAQQGVLACPECAVGLLVLDPVSAPRWRLDCSRCSFLIYLPKELHAAKVAKEPARRVQGGGSGSYRSAAAAAAECSSKLLRLDWLKGKSPLPGGDTEYTGCLSCEEFLMELCEVKHGRIFVKRGGGGGRGRGGGEDDAAGAGAGAKMSTRA